MLKNLFYVTMWYILITITKVGFKEICAPVVIEHILSSYYEIIMCSFDKLSGLHVFYIYCTLHNDGGYFKY